MYRLTVLLSTFLASLSGCAHHQLNVDTINQASTLNTVFEQQVLDNLAMFVHNPHSIAYFASIDDGTSFVDDQGSVSASPIDDFREVTGLSGRRQIRESWSLAPVTDPNRLALMSCAYQRAIGFVDPCSDCAARERDWYGTNLPNLCCQVGPGFFMHGSKYDLLRYRCKHRTPCLKVGSHCGTYIWIPCNGVHGFGLLHRAILDFATGDEAPTATKVVRQYVNACGLPTLEKESIGYVEATIPIDAKLPSIIVQNEVDGDSCKADSSTPNAKTIEAGDFKNKLNSLFKNEGGVPITPELFQAIPGLGIDAQTDGDFQFRLDAPSSEVLIPSPKRYLNSDGNSLPLPTVERQFHVEPARRRLSTLDALQNLEAAGGLD